MKLKIKDTRGVALSIVLDFVQMDRGGTRYTEGGICAAIALKRSKIPREFDLLVDGSATRTVPRGRLKLVASMGES